MSLVGLSLLVAVLLGAVAGGSVERLGTLRLRRLRLVAAALGAQLAGAVVGGPFHAAGLAASAALVVAFLTANRGVRGTGLVALGLAANALVVGANGAMPVSRDAADRAGVDLTDVELGADARHVVADRSTRLPVLGDVVPLPLPLRPEVVSPGDVLVAAGLAQLVVLGVLRPLPVRHEGRPRPALPPLGPPRAVAPRAVTPRTTPRLPPAAPPTRSRPRAPRDAARR